MSLPALQASTRPAWIEPDDSYLQAVLKAVAIYDGFIDGIRVKEACASLDEITGPLVPVEHQAWSFQSLARLDIRSAAIHASENADVLIIAADAGQPLPDHVASWIERLLHESDERPAMLVALHDDDPDFHESSGELTAQLHGIASRWGMEFVPNGGLERRIHEHSLQPHRPHIGDELSAIGDPPFQRFCTWHGGINE